MEIGSLSLILIVGLLLLISIGVPMGFASGFMGAVLVFLYIGEHALGILLSRYSDTIQQLLQPVGMSLIFPFPDTQHCRMHCWPSKDKLMAALLSEPVTSPVQIHLLESKQMAEL